MRLLSLPALSLWLRLKVLHLGLQFGMGVGALACFLPHTIEKSYN